VRCLESLAAWAWRDIFGKLGAGYRFDPSTQYGEIDGDDCAVSATQTPSERKRAGQHLQLDPVSEDLSGIGIEVKEEPMAGHQVLRGGVDSKGKIEFVDGSLYDLRQLSRPEFHASVLVPPCIDKL
jgi:hypothetical protein